MRVACKVAAQTLDHLGDFIRKGVTTEALDSEAEAFIRKTGCEPAFKGYNDYTHATCICVNGEVLHCPPSDKVLKKGDIVTVDLGAKYLGFHSDTAKTYLVGEVDPRAKRLVDVGYEALRKGIDQAMVGHHVADISNMIHYIIKKNRYGAVKEFMGHGIGKEIHEMPQIPCTELKEPGPALKKGMVICIEPILTLNPSGRIKEDGRWRVVTPDGCKAVHWEHVVLITDLEPEILTLRKDEKR